MKRVIILTVFAIGMVFAAAGSIAAQSTVAGEWDASMNTPGGPRPFKLILKVDGEKLSGTVKRASGDLPLAGMVKGSDISFAYMINYNGHDLDLSFAGKITGDTMGGGVSFGGNGDDEWSAKRVSPAMSAEDMDHGKMDHAKMVMKNGEKSMGFSQTATTHHFLIMKDGGAIQVEANDKKDTASRDKVRAHLAEIAKQFQAGIFTTPFAVHGTVPPGVADMDKLKEKITYTYGETDSGARVRITTKNSDALTAIHAFLKFQIKEHKTGDPTEVVK